MEAIRVCIGTEPRTEIPCKVLEHSIRVNHRGMRPIEFHHLDGGDWKRSGPLQEYTGFSLLRWTIPERFGYRGKAIYLDADQLCVGDIEELWRADWIWPGSRGAVWCTRYQAPGETRFESSVMLIDCEKAQGQLPDTARIEELLRDDTDRVEYQRIMRLHHVTEPPREIPAWWNVMDARDMPPGWAERFVDPDARILHYTRVKRQPWYFPENERRDVWEAYLERAIDDGAVSRDEIVAACERFSLENPDRPDGMHPYWRKVARERASV